MDQPTNLEITIKGDVEAVKNAAIAMQKSIESTTRGFDENSFVVSAERDFETIMSDSIDILGSYDFDENGDGTAEFSTEQESYGCIEEGDIKNIAKAIIAVAPTVEAHITAVITITYSEGYDLCVEVDCADGKMKVETSEEYYEDWDDEDEEDE